jgi:F0F1-type ATP synthase assembly protein I
MRDLPGLAAFAAMGTTIASCLAIGVVLGLYADHLWHSAPWGLIFGIVLGTVAAVASVTTLVRRYL